MFYHIQSENAIVSLVKYDNWRILNNIKLSLGVHLELTVLNLDRDIMDTEVKFNEMIASSIAELI